MSDLNTSSEYWNEINSIAYDLWENAFEWNTDPKDDIETRTEAAEEAIQDCGLHQAIDGHQWVIYNAYNLSVIFYSENAGYMIDNFGAESAGHYLESGLDTLHNAIAFWCMYADVQDNLEAAKDEFINDLMAEHGATHADAS